SWNDYLLHLKVRMNIRAYRCIYLCLLTAAAFNMRSGCVAAQTGESSENQALEIVMKNVMYHFTDRIAVHIVQLQGHLKPTKAGTIVFFDDKNSFILAMASGEISISCNSLAQVLNENVFSASDAPIKDVSIESKN